MYKAHKIKLYPTKSQETLLRKSCGVARVSFNWALAKWREMYEAGEKPSAYTLIKLQNSIKKVNYPFFLDVSKTAPQYAIHDVAAAFKKMWKEKAGYPKFKKKGRKDSFVAIEKWQDFNQKNFKIHIPRVGKIKCAENLRFQGKVINVVVKRIASYWFAIVNIDVEKCDPTLKQNLDDNQVIVGVDLGINKLAVCSNGRVFENPKALRKNIKKLKRYQKTLSRRVIGSKNRQKQQMRVAKLHYRISCIRSNALHQATTSILKDADIVVIEDLGVKGMLKNKTLSGAISDSSFGAFRRIIEYKSMWLNKEVVVANRFFPSSKICSCCGAKKETLNLSTRTYSCEFCNSVLDRDLNAAVNLKKFGTAKYVETFRKENASGFGSSPVVIQDSLKLKEEVIFKNLYT
jgi:putative transposase